MPKIVDADARREDVADALFRVVRRDGFAAVSLRTVAREAELALGSVRHYFGSQSELMDYSFRLVAARIHARVEELLAPLEDAEHTDLESLLDGCVDVLAQLLPLDEVRQEEATVLLSFALAARTAPLLHSAGQDSYRGTAAAVGRIILLLLDSGAAAPELVPLLEAERLMAVVDGLGLHMLVQPEWAGGEQALATLRTHLSSLMDTAAE
ncbi:TetR/AcrR family transcriptional regulator [Arthrobacter sp. 35W]|uniref:TetR/AcrR family transcriptional regulator n=1 Tax=Arthrobacter sp. 35W TaxID=1132441 RepID=UPI0003F651B1|nr:TetR family transcriptional regulator C-terminal domain-containing protein [Arthrobacter sp. 35W]